MNTRIQLRVLNKRNYNKTLLTNMSEWLHQIVKFQTFLYVQLRLVCSTGVSPVRAKARNPVAWIAASRVTELLKSIDKVILKGDKQVTRPQA